MKKNIVIHSINRAPKKVISIDKLKKTDTVSYRFMIKILKKLVIEENFLDMIKNISYKIPPANIIFNGERVNAFFLSW